MKALLVCALLTASLKAEPAHWEVVSATASMKEPASATWTFTLRNVSGRALEIGEHWSDKGKASANVCMIGPEDSPFAPKMGVPGWINTLISEPCHQPWTRLKVEAGETVTAVMPRMGDKDQLGLVIIEGKERVMVAELSKVKIEGEKKAAEEPAKK